MRWKKWIGGLALLLAMASGCKQQVFLTQADLQESRQIATDMLENAPRVVDKPLTDICPRPPTTSDPERGRRATSPWPRPSPSRLEQGNDGIATEPDPSALPDFDRTCCLLGCRTNLASLTPPSNARFNGSNDAIRVLRLDPAIVGAGIESALSKFDAVWSSSATWNTTDRPVGTSLDTFQSAGQVNVIQQQAATVSTGFIKPLSTGGVASITFDTAYTDTNLPSRVNPSYVPTLQFGFEQPLLQGFGTEINELRAASPGSLLHPGTFNTQPTAEGILVTRLRYDQSRVNFELQVNFMLLNVELAYWNLYYSYWNLYAQETGLRLGYEAWRIFNARYQAGKVNVADLAQTRGQYELFRSQRLTALNSVLEYERELRFLLGLPAEDGTRLVPADEPTLAAYTPDWTSAMQEALALKPELILARQEVKAAQMNLRVARDSELPDIRLTATYDFNDIGSRLDGPGTENAFRNLSDGRFSNWSVGIQGNIPIGFRDAHAKTRVAKLRCLARDLRSGSATGIETYSASWSNCIAELDFQYEQIKINRAQREAYGQQIRALSEQIKVGSQTPDILLEAQRFYVTALQAEYQFIAAYNETLIGWEFTKGTIMQHDNVVISEAGLPSTAQVRAVDHQRERTAALILRERPLPTAPLHCDSDVGVIPQIPPGSAGTLPSILSDKSQPLPPAPELPPGVAPIDPRKTNSFRSTLPPLSKYPTIPGTNGPMATPDLGPTTTSPIPGLLPPTTKGLSIEACSLQVGQPRGMEMSSQTLAAFCFYRRCFTLDVSYLSCSSSFTSSSAPGGLKN